MKLEGGFRNMDSEKSDRLRLLLNEELTPILKKMEKLEEELAVVQEVQKELINLLKSKE
jgi:uncharacterized protein (UPF0335 family)